VNNLEVKIKWNNQHGFWWNEACAMVVKVFGVPGARYTYHPTISDMIFLFNNEKDAILCKLLLSEIAE